MAVTERTTRTLTFVFTDIEGSTRLLRDLGDEYVALLRAHDDIIRRATVDAGGEPFGSEGDAQNLAFSDAESAVAAAVSIQRQLAVHAWPSEHQVKVRMGIHTGRVQQDGRDYTGMPLHETARIAAAGHGGQVLLSPTTTALVAGHLPDGVRLRDLGAHRFKDLQGSVRIDQLEIDGLPADFPPLRAAGVPGAVLPADLTPFVERGEVAEIVDLAATSRLVTLTGPGGTGKTRLSVEVAKRLASDFDDGTWFVALDAITEPELVASEIVTALRLNAGAESPIDRLLDHLRDRSVLLVLDNFEQVIDAGADVARIIAECPSAAVIATSRIALRVYGEQEYPVPALTLPASSTGLTASEALHFGSIRLFEARARAAKPSFEVTQENVEVVADIVRQVDGLPLAIELAAARLRLLPLTALRTRLEDRLGTLRGNTHDRSSRQQTLRGAITWSHDLLNPTDRLLFARIGVFAGSASLPQIEAVTVSEAEPDPDILDGLESLTEQSLLRVLESDEQEPRFAMLATIREYAREQLTASGERTTVERRHAQAYLDLAEALGPAVIGADGAESGNRLERDHDDLRAALDWMVANDEAEQVLRMLIAMWRFWQVRGHLREGGERAEAVLAMPSVSLQPAALRSRAEAAAGGIAYWRSEYQRMYSHYTHALELARQTDDKALMAEALYNKGFAPYMSEKLTVGHEQTSVGKASFEAALALFRELGDEAGIAKASWSLAMASAYDDDLASTRRLAEDSLTAARAIDDRFQMGWSLHLLGQATILAGDLELAGQYLNEAFDIFEATGDVSAIVLLLLDSALLAHAYGEEVLAWKLLGAEERLRTATGTDLGGEGIEFRGLATRRIPETAEEREWVEAGRVLSTDEAVALARGLATSA